MGTFHEGLVEVSAILLENGTPFHSKVLGLPHFRVPLSQAERDGFLLELSSKN